MENNHMKNKASRNACQQILGLDCYSVSIGRAVIVAQHND
jgi:hypothetical protein